MPYMDVKLGSDSLLLRFVGRVDYVVGRLPKADLQLRDMSVSRLHVQFFIDSRGQAFVKDLGSSGGTLVNDSPISNTMARLHDGTRIRIGQARVIFYDAQPPVNAVDPPGKSEPRGLIRFNFRKRKPFTGAETVLAADKVSGATADGGPAEPPPEINSAEFSEDGKAIEDASVRAKPPKPAAQAPAKPAPAQAAAPAKPGAPAKPMMPGNKKKDTGIMTAPWEEKREFATGKPPAKPPAVPLPKGTGALPPKPGAPAPAQAQRGGKPLPPAFESTEPEVESRKTIYEPPLPPEMRQQGRVAPRPGSLGGPKPSAPVQKAPPPQPLSQLDLPQVEPPKPKGDSLTKRRTLAEEMLEDYEPSAAMPTVNMGKAAPPAAKKEYPKPPAPPPEPAPAQTEEKAGSAVDPELSTDEIAEYFGGERATGKLQDVKYADTDPEQRKTNPPQDEVRFGPASARLANAPEIEDDLGQEGAPAVAEEPSASAEAGNKIEESDLEESSVSSPDVLEIPQAESAPPPPAAAAESAPPAAAAPAEPAPPPQSEADAEAERQRKLEEVKREAKEAARSGKPVTAPLPAKPAAKAASYPVALPGKDGIKRETKKLMKSKIERDTAPVQEFTIPVSDNPTQKVPLPNLAPGAKTLYIPKPEAQARAETAARNKASKPELASMAQGPGGDTLAVGNSEMLKEIEEEYQKSISKGDVSPLKLAEESVARKEPVLVDKPIVDPSKTPADVPALPDQETVKKQSPGDEDMEFVVDDNYAFFTPPPPTRKDRATKQESDVIDAGDLLAQSEKLPKSKQAQEPPQADKTVSE